jgi:cytoskeleton-associated protein 5
MMTEDGAGAPVDEDFSGIPIAERLAHKNWKARVDGYSALVKAFGISAEETDAVFEPYKRNPDVLKRMAMDSNAVAQDRALDVLLAFVKFAGVTAAQ